MLPDRLVYGRPPPVSCTRVRTWQLGVVILALLGSCGTSERSNESSAGDEDPAFPPATWGAGDPRRDRVRERIRRECEVAMPGSRKVATQDVLIQELAAFLRWIASVPKTEKEVRTDSWCAWRIEKEEGLRVKLPTQTPPPIRDLPDASLLVGLPRSRILEELDEPADGCWSGDRIAGAPRCPCGESPHMNYSFYRLDGQPGGGDELWVDFDAAGVCVQARWVGSQ